MDRPCGYKKCGSWLTDMLYSADLDENIFERRAENFEQKIMQTARLLAQIWYI